MFAKNMTKQKNKFWSRRLPELVSDLKQKGAVLA